jgi:hypothetical protein
MENLCGGFAMTEAVARLASPSRAGFSGTFPAGGSGSEAAVSAGVAARAPRQVAHVMQVHLVCCLDSGEAEGAGHGAGATASVSRTISEGWQLPVRLARPTLTVLSSGGFFYSGSIVGPVAGGGADFGRNP